ncbi:MAG: 3-isopropylmalate dehydratase [Burkholderiaceae bacterium]
MTTTGRAWKLPGNVDTDALAPGKAMSGGLGGIAPHCLKTIRPEFADEVKPADLIVAGANFGVGSSREQAAGVLRHLGLAAVLAPSFAGLFYRNAFNLGLPALVCAQTQEIADGARLSLDMNKACVIDADTGDRWSFEPVPEFLQAMIDAGGLLPQLRARLAADKSQNQPTA